MNDFGFLILRYYYVNSLLLCLNVTFSSYIIGYYFAKILSYT